MIKFKKIKTRPGAYTNKIGTFIKIFTNILAAINKKNFITIIFCLIIVFDAYPHSGKAKYHVIIDTDCAFDDLRAINLLLASPDFEILAIITSDGILHPHEGYVKVKSLLNKLNHQGIPVAYGKQVNNHYSVCHDLCININWGDEQNIVVPPKPTATELLIKELEAEEKPVIVLCLGSLTNIQSVLSDKSLNNEDIFLWYCSDYLNKTGMNFQMDSLAAKVFLKSNCHKYIISNNNGPDFIFDTAFYNNICNIKSLYAENIKISHSNPNVQNNIKSDFFELWDDLLPMYLLYPKLFTEKENTNNTFSVIPVKNSGKTIKENVLTILKNEKFNENKVFKYFPVNPDNFLDDVKIHTDEIVNNYGISEWRAVVLTNELHGHLGIYAVVGAKMGIRVRDYFHIGLDDIKIIAYTGARPPLSCMIDGLQVSTGATVGHGLIGISDDQNFRPEADFIFKNHKIKVKLKTEYWKIIKMDIQKGINQYGNLTPEYWLFIRSLAIKYWKEWDRNEIFEINQL